MLEYATQRAGYYAIDLNEIFSSQCLALKIDRNTDQSNQSKSKDVSRPCNARNS